MPMFNCRHCGKRIRVPPNKINPTYLCRNCFQKDVKLSHSLGLDPYA